MNSQFKNSNLGFYLYAFIIVIIAFASIFVVWYMITGYSLGTYKEDTILGSVYLGGLKEEEVEQKIDERIDRWLNDESIVFEVTYQGYNYEFDRKLFYFDLNRSLYHLNDGTVNILFATYQGSDRQNIISDISNLDFLVGISDQFDYETLINDVLDDAGYMKSYSSQNLENYLIDREELITDINSITLDLYNGINVDDVISGITEVYPDGRIVAENKELFDIANKLGENLNDSELSILSTGILALILESNFVVHQVNYIPEIDYINYDYETFPYFGHNARINKVIGDSFSFYNPNNSDYYFVIERVMVGDVVDETKIIISLVGLEFINDIEIEIVKTPLHYITQETVNDDLLQSGFDGAIIEVVRTIIDINENIVYQDIILFEFYPPIKEIIIKP